MYGSLSANSDNSELTLKNFGKIEITYVNVNNISIKTLEEVLECAKSDDEIPTNEVVKMFTYDVWIVKEADNAEIGSEFLMTKNGTYVYTFNGNVYVKYWRYIDETTWGYGWNPAANQGEATNVKLTYTEWRLEDTAGYNYYMTR